MLHGSTVVSSTSVVLEGEGKYEVRDSIWLCFICSEILVGRQRAEGCVSVVKSGSRVFGSVIRDDIASISAANERVYDCTSSSGPSSSGRVSLDGPRSLYMGGTSSSTGVLSSVSALRFSKACTRAWVSDRAVCKDEVSALVNALILLADVSSFETRDSSAS